MAYNNYLYPATYQPLYPQTIQPMYQQQAQPISQPTMQSGNSITWVQGETGAKAYPLAPASNVLLMDSEQDVFYLKSTDASGMPMPLRTFEYKEVLPASEVVETKHSHDVQEVDMSMYATKDEISEIRRLLEEMKRKQGKGDRSNGKQSV